MTVVLERRDVLVVAHRRKRLAAGEIAEILANLGTLPITFNRPEPESVMKLPSVALEHELTAYDACCLELALRLGLPMATNDKALRRAMTATGVKRVEP